MRILLVYPKTPLTFWGFNNALKFISKKSAEPPLGLITIAAMLPKEWEKKLIDMNVQPLEDKDILWADYVFLSGMNIHIKSFKEIIHRANKLGVKIVAGGPLATMEYQNFLGVDYFILNEAEITLPLFLDDLKKGVPKHIYTSTEFPDLGLTPAPRWDLLQIKKYATMSIQYSRGCPYDCEFCSITMLNGRRPRVKKKEQFLGELNRLYLLGWRGDVSIVDDNFIGNKRILKNEFLPALINWSKEKKYPFRFITEVSVNLSDDEELTRMLVEAGVFNVFVGIETPNNESLIECGKAQNLRRDLVASIKKLQHNGLIVSGGFIVGFDNDRPDIFKQQINFIQKSGIVTAMVGLLNAPRGTKLYKRLKSENRLIENITGNNMDGSINFIPKMNYRDLLNGYSNILNTIYSQKGFYERIKQFLLDYKLPSWNSYKLNIKDVKAFLKLIWKLGVIEKGRIYFWRLLFTSLFKYPKKFSVALTFAVYGFHFRKVVATI